MNFLLGCLINLNREEKEMEEIVYSNVSSRSACRERKNWFQWVYGMWLCPKHNVLLTMLLNLFSPVIQQTTMNPSSKKSGEGLLLHDLAV